jgi:tRNA pseudouridine38-40 synthase
VLPPLEYGRVWHVASPLDFQLLEAAASQFVGTHDFAAFAASRRKAEKSTVRKINSVRVRQRGPCLTIEFDGEGFLYKMVRLMVGSIVQCALGKMTIAELRNRLVSAQTTGARLVAPAGGLFLVRVRY